MDQMEELKQRVINGEAPQVRELTQKALDEGVAAEVILNEALIPAMAVVGKRFECGEYYVPEMLIAARAMKFALELLRPRLAAANVQPIGKIVIGTVQGDLHDIGKNLVSMMLEGAGFEVIDLGVDVPPGKFVEAVRLHQPRLIGLSALLTTTMPHMKTTIEALASAGLRGQVKIMVGGAPVTDQFAREVGADLYAPDAAVAADRARAAVN